MVAINYAFSIFFLLNSGSTSPNLKSYKDYNPTSTSNLYKEVSDSDSCIYIIIQLLSKSEFRKNELLDNSEFSFEKLTYTVENIINDSIIVIHAYLSPALNDSEPHDRTVAWLQIDLKKKLLEDISIDPANPEILNFDAEFLKEINIDCLTESNKKYFQEMNK